MTDDTPAVEELRAHIEELSRQISDLQRHNKELREAIDALLQPARSELLPRNLAHLSRRRLTGC